MWFVHLLFAGLLSGIDPALEEAITALEENAAKITHGRATYTVDITKPDSTLVSSEQVEMLFDHDRYAWMEGRWRCIWTPEYAMHFHTSEQGVPRTPVEAKSGNSVHINPPSRATFSPWRYAPGILGFSNRTTLENPPTSMSDHLRKAAESSIQTVAISKESSRLVVTIAYSESKRKADVSLNDYKEEFEFDIANGFTPKVIEYWGRKEGPYYRQTSTFKLIDNTAWVADTTTVEFWKVNGNQREPEPKRMIKLNEIDLKYEPKESDFQIDWIAPPIGTPVQDRINNTKFRYGIADADEKD